MDWQLTERKHNGRLACLLALDGVDVWYGWNGLSKYVFRDESDVVLCCVKLRPCRSKAIELWLALAQMTQCQVASFLPRRSYDLLVIFWHPA